MRYLNSTDIEFPVFLSKTDRQRYGFVIRIQKFADELYSVLEVSEGVKNLGHYVEYKFKRKNNCWTLIEIRDQST